MLLKVRTSDGLLVARSLYGDDKDFLITMGSDAVKSLDNIISEIKEIILESMFFKVEDLSGSLMGFFIVPTDRNIIDTSFFFIKKAARIQEYYIDFYKLVSQTIYGGIYQTLNEVNSENFSSLLDNPNVIANGFRPYGRSILN
jgi:hypothetical protein